MWCVVRVTLAVWHVVAHPRQGNHRRYRYGTYSRICDGRVEFLILGVGFVFDQVVFDRRDQFSTLSISKTPTLIFLLLRRKLVLLTWPFLLRSGRKCSWNHAGSCLSGSSRDTCSPCTWSAVCDWWNLGASCCRAGWQSWEGRKWPLWLPAVLRHTLPKMIRETLQHPHHNSLVK